MTEKHLKKQYWINTSEIGHIYINDGENHMSWQGVVDTLNTLNDENGHLSSKISDLECENEQLKQFKEDVFNKIDMHLRMLPTARDNEFNEDAGDPSLYTGAIYMLETLKKELKE